MYYVFLGNIVLEKSYFLNQGARGSQQFPRGTEMTFNYLQ